MWLLGWIRLSKHAKAHVYLPADRLPVAAGRAELRRLRALVAIGARDAERGDARVAEGEDDVARRHFAHGLVEGIADAARHIEKQDCRIEGIGAMGLKSEFVKKA